MFLLKIHAHTQWWTVACCVLVYRKVMHNIEVVFLKIATCSEAVLNRAFCSIRINWNMEESCHWRSLLDGKPLVDCIYFWKYFCTQRIIFHGLSYFYECCEANKFQIHPWNFLIFYFTSRVENKNYATAASCHMLFSSSFCSTQLFDTVLCEW